MRIDPEGQSYTGREPAIALGYGFAGSLAARLPVCAALLYLGLLVAIDPEAIMRMTGALTQILAAFARRTPPPPVRAAAGTLLGVRLSGALAAAFAFAALSGLAG